MIEMENQAIVWEIKHTAERLNDLITRAAQNKMHVSFDVYTASPKHCRLLKPDFFMMDEALAA